MSIFTKVIVWVMMLSIIPLLIMNYTSLRYLNNVEDVALEKVKEIEKIAVADSTDALNKLGQEIIKEKAYSVAKQLKIFLQKNQNLTLAELQNNPEFQEISVQPVGKTGYTATINEDKLTITSHKYPEKIGFSFYDSREKLPAIYKIMINAFGEHESSGYYDWEEPDGSLREKYLHMVPIGIKTADGFHLSVAATTYIDEFNTPAELISEKLKITRDTIIEKIEGTHKLIKRISIFTIMAIIIAVTVLSLVFSSALTRPIKSLRDAAVEIGKGDLNTKIDIKTGDEIGDLASSFQQMVIDLKESQKDLANYNKKLEKDVAERTKEVSIRTKELEAKNAELEKFNRMTLDREQKMIELKAEIKKLKEKK